MGQSRRERYVGKTRVREEGGLTKKKRHGRTGKGRG